MIEIELLKPKLDGGRFEEHAIPLDFLKDLAVLEEFIISVAKAEWIKDHEGRERTPPGFMSGVSVKLAGVEEGSAVPVLKLFLATAVALLPGAIPEEQTYLERARTKITEAVAAAEAGANIAVHLRPRDLAYFDRFGRGLRDGESIGLQRDGGAAMARLTPQTRRTLVLAAPGVEFITDDAIRRGKVVDTNDTDGKFTIRLPGGQEVRAPLSPEHRDTVIEAQKDSATGVRVAVRGIGRFNRTNKLVNFEEVEDVTALEPLDIPARIDELRLLRAGWLDGGGKALDSAALDKLSTAFTTHYPDGLPLPYTFPTENGGVQFEWRLENASPEIEIDLVTLRGEWLSDDEATIELSIPEGWTDLARRISALAGANQNGENA
jgi:hypothetical protein